MTQEKIPRNIENGPLPEELSAMPLDELCNIAYADQNEAANILLRIEGNSQTTTSVPTHCNPADMLQRIQGLATERVTSDFENASTTCVHCGTVQEKRGQVGALAALALRMLEKQPPPVPSDVNSAPSASTTAQPRARPPKDSNMTYSQASNIEAGKKARTQKEPHQPTVESIYLRRHGCASAMIIVCTFAIVGAVTRFDWVHVTTAALSAFIFLVATCVNGPRCGDPDENNRSSTRST